MFPVPQGHGLSSLHFGRFSRQEICKFTSSTILTRLYSRSCTLDLLIGLAFHWGISKVILSNYFCNSHWTDLIKFFVDYLVLELKLFWFCWMFEIGTLCAKLCNQFFFNVLISDGLMLVNSISSFFLKKENLAQIKIEYVDAIRKLSSFYSIVISSVAYVCWPKCEPVIQLISLSIEPNCEKAI